jgi:hypothetical protein
MGNVSDKFVEKIKTQFIFNYMFFFFENSTLSDIMWRNSVQSNRPNTTLLNGAWALQAG